MSERRLPREIGLLAQHYQNAALYQHQLPRLVVGGAQGGQVLTSQTPDLSLKEAPRLNWGNMRRPPERAYHFTASEVGFGGEIFRTWQWVGQSPEAHTQQAILTLIGADAEKVDMVRSE